MNNNCRVIQDLLPLYVDKTASSQTSEIVKQHLSFCPDCRKACRDYKKVLKTTQPSFSEQSCEPDFSQISKKLSNERKFEVLLTTFALVLALAAVAYDVVMFLTKEKGEKGHDRFSL